MASFFVWMKSMQNACFLANMNVSQTGIRNRNLIVASFMQNAWLTNMNVLIQMLT